MAIPTAQRFALPLVRSSDDYPREAFFAKVVDRTTDSPASSRKLFYYSTSMRPTFTPGDLLTIVPYRDSRARVGDVIVFPDPEHGGYVTHRIIEVAKEGVITRGDNIMNQVDPWMLSPDDIVGYVAYAERGGHKRRILGGPVGIAYHQIHRTISRNDRPLRRILFQPARFLRLGRLLKRLDLSYLLPKRYRPRILAIRRGKEHNLILLMGSRIIGRRLPGGHGWSIKLLFLPFINEMFLKEAETRHHDSWS